MIPIAVAAYSDRWPPATITIPLPSNVVSGGNRIFSRRLSWIERIREASVGLFGCRGSNEE